MLGTYSISADGDSSLSVTLVGVNVPSPSLDAGVITTSPASSSPLISVIVKTAGDGTAYGSTNELYTSADVSPATEYIGPPDTLVEQLEVENPAEVLQDELLELLELLDDDVLESIMEERDVLQLLDDDSSI